MKRIHLLICLMISLILYTQCSLDNLSGVENPGGTSVEVVGLYGVVIGADQKPSSNAQLVLRRIVPDAQESNMVRDEIRANVATNSDGSFFIPEKGTGTFFLQATDTAQNAAGECFSISTEHADTTHLDTIYLSRTGSISVTLFPNITDTDHVVYNVFIAKKGFNIKTPEIYDEIKTPETTYIRYTKNQLAPDTYEVKVCVTYYDAPTIDNSREKYTLDLYDTLVIVKAGELVQVPTVIVSNIRTAESQTVFDADSLAYVSICEKCGVSKDIPPGSTNPRTWRIQSLNIQATNDVTFKDIAVELNQLNALQRVWLSNVKGDTLPAAFCRMNQLQSLTLRDGTLTSIPDGIVSLPKLQYINFIDHKISSLPSFLYGVNWNTSRLQSVDLRDNPIVIANWEQQQFVNYLHTKLYYFAFQTVTADDFAIVRSILDGNGYQTVDMNKYIITAYGRVTGIYLPPEISLSQIPPGLKTLDSLKEFVIGRHTMTSVPEWLKQQKALQVIHIPNGRLSSLPELLSTMPKLHYLNVSNNNLVAAPAWISTITKWPFQSIVADFSCNRIQPSAIGCKKQDCLIEPQRSEHEIDIDNTLLSKDLEVVKRLFKRHSPYMYTTHIQMPYNYFTRVKNSRVISISLPLISTDFSLLFKDLSELDSLKTLDFEMYWAMKAVSTGIIDEQLKSITVRLPSVTELILGAYQSINRLPDGLLQIVPNVKRVGLRGMSFTSIPDALKNCQGLESVDLFCNKLNNLNEQDKAWMNTYCKTSQTVLARPFGTIYINENENWEKSQVK